MMKKTMAILLVVMVTLTFVNVSAAPETVYSEDFQSYNVWTQVDNYGADSDNGVWGVASGSNKVLIENELKTSPTFGGTNWGTMYAIDKDTTMCNDWQQDNNVKIDDSRVLLMRSNGGDIAAMNIIKPLGSSETGYTYKVDVRNYFSGKITKVSSIRLASSTDEKNYYELAMVSENPDNYSAAGTVRFVKNTNAIAKDIYAASDSSNLEYVNDAGSIISGLENGRTKWFTFEMSITKNIINYKVTDKATGVVVAEDSYIDKENILADGFIPQMCTSGLDCRTLFDNISIEKIEAGANMKSLKVFEDDFTDRALYTATGAGLGSDYDNHVPGIGSGSSYSIFPNEWVTSGMYGGGYWATDYRIQYEKQYANQWNENDPDTTNKVLKMSVANSNAAAINMVKSLGNVNDGYIFSANVRNYFSGNINESTGIRLVNKNNEADYYELALMADSSTMNSYGVSGLAAAPRFTKVVGGDKNTTAFASADTKFAYVERASAASACDLHTGGLYSTHHTAWFTLSMAISGSTVSWSVKNLETGNVDWTGMHTFDSAIDVNAFIPQLYTYSSMTDATSLAYFDNVEIIKTGIVVNDVGNSSYSYNIALSNVTADTKCIVAYYDANGALVSANAESVGEAGITFRTNAAVVPEGVASVKIFAVDSFSTLMPICKADSCDF